MLITERPVPDDFEHLFLRGTDMVGGLIGLIKTLSTKDCRERSPGYLLYCYHNTFP